MPHHNTDKNSMKYKLQHMPKWMLFMVVIAFIAILALFIYITLLRYSFMGDALGKGNIKTAALLFTPELSASLANILSIF
jgi:hypothetical protein